MKVLNEFINIINEKDLFKIETHQSLHLSSCLVIFSYYKYIKHIYNKQ
jgi:hypothetical protein